MSLKESMDKFSSQSPETWASEELNLYFGVSSNFSQSLHKQTIVQ
jgi:hypothetical protein